MTRRSDHSRTLATHPGGDAAVALFAGCGLALVVARHVLPAESVHLGETLWIVPLWLLLALAWILTRQRFDLPCVRFDRGDWALLLLATGHVIAGLTAHGNMRAAINGLTEWIGVAISVGLLRRWLADGARWRQFLAVIATAGVVLSGLGIWQYAAEYPALRRQVAELAQLESVQQAGDLTERQSARLQRLRTELGQFANETDPNIRYALRQRLMASTEPLACFALANTLAGVLAVSLLLLLGALSTAIAAGCPWTLWARIAGPALIVAFCLLLTKSRTAWIGLLIGASLWGVVAARGALLCRRTLKIAAAGLLVAVALIGAAWLAGALDRLVVLETSKSFRYRLEYWTGAWGVIRDHLWLGVGPGNFRQNYLRHKVAGSSEEILDPHNMFLDVWSAGGLVALFGLLLAFGIAVARWRNFATTAGTGIPSGEFPHRSDRMLLCAGVAGIALVWLKLGVIDMQWDPRLPALLAGWIVAVLILPPLQFTTAAQLAAGVTLGVHLLGAGGVGMPVVATTLLLLWLGPAAPSAAAVLTPASPNSAQRRNIATCIGLSALVAVSLIWVVIPSTLANLSMNAAMSEMSTRGDAASARRLLEQAVRADGDDPLPYVYLAQLEHDQARLNGDPSGAFVEAALSYLRDAVRRDPENSKTHLLKAEWELEQFDRFGAGPLIEEAVRSAQAAAERDPQNSKILATLATAYAKAGRTDEAGATAARALELDALNLQLAHYDRLLDDDVRNRLRALAGRPDVN